jgi:hypothetical protein
MATTRKNNPAPSPRKKQLKKGADRAIQKQAFNELLLRRANNGGKFNFGDIQNVVNEFQALGYDAVTRRNLQYRLNNFIKKGTTTLFSERECPTTVKLANVTEVSPLTVDDFGSNPGEKNPGDNNMSTSLSVVEDDVEEGNLSPIGEGEGESDIAKKRREGLARKKQQEVQNQLVQQALLTISSKYAELRDSAKANPESNYVEKGTLAALIQSTTMELGLPEGIIKKQTILSRLRRNNLTGFAHQKVSPLDAMEPLLVEWCIKMAKIGQALTKENVMDLATELIEGTEHANKLEEFKKKRNLRTKMVRK